MKNKILAFILLFGAMSLQAQEFSKLNSEAAEVANLMSNASVKTCVSALESSLGGKLVYSSVEKNSNRHPDYLLEAVLIKKGDISTAVLNIKLIANLPNPWASNVSYLCQVVEK